MTILSFILQTFCPALLPPPSNSSNIEYYNILGLDKRNKNNDIAAIRKAYKIKSLQLHPDKIIQRGGNNVDDAKEQYELVQEAYSVLSDEHKKRQYNDMNCNVERYKFVYEQKTLYTNPIAVHENLLNSSCIDRTRLLLLTILILILVLLQPILIVGKINSILLVDDNDNNDRILTNISWLIILIPTWVIYGSYVIGMVIATGIFVITSNNNEPLPAIAMILNGDYDNKNTKIRMILQCIENITFIIGLILLCIQFDMQLDDKYNWYYISIPFYISILIHILIQIHTITQYRYALHCMVSTDYIKEKYDITEDNIHDNLFMMGNDNDEGDDDDIYANKLKEILQKYIIVHTDRIAVAVILHTLEQHEETQITDDEIEEIRVQTSEEYNTVIKNISNIHLNITRIIIMYIPFIILVTLQLEGTINISWWIIFIPLFIGYGLPLLQSCFICCCISSDGPHHDDNIHIHDDDDDNDKDDEKDINNKNNDKNNNDNNINVDNNKDDEKKNDKMKVGEEDVKTKMPQQTPILKSSSTNEYFVPPEGFINEFNQINIEKDESAVAVVASVETNTLNHNNGQKINNNKKEESKDSVDKKEINDNNDKKDGKSDDNGHDDHDDDDDHHHKSGWSERMHNHEIDNEDYVEMKVKAMTGCCMNLFYIIILCLIVSKLESSYDDNDDDDNDNNKGFNTFWILFPFFLIAFIILLCCCCCIYSPSTTTTSHNDNSDDDINKHQNDDEENQNNNIINNHPSNDDNNITSSDHEPTTTTPMTIVPSKEEDGKNVDVEKQTVTTSNNNNEGKVINNNVQSDNNRTNTEDASSPVEEDDDVGGGSLHDLD